MTNSNKDSHFVTVSMAEILLAQNMVSDTRKVIRSLLEIEPNNPRVLALVQRLDEVTQGEAQKLERIPEHGVDRIHLTRRDAAVVVAYEITDRGIAIAKSAARYSGRMVVRIFTAAPGPRGVRTVTRDFDVAVGAAALPLLGMQRPAVHVASVGYLANTGTFVPLAQTQAPLVIS
jgi:hypothetical protein